jgi:ATP-dependent DNA helicase RecG
MNPLKDEELTALLDDLESDRVERKSTWSASAADKVREAVCAFANDLPGHAKPGVVFIGAQDDGSPGSLTVTDQLLLTMADIKSDGRIVPQPSMTVERRRLKGADMAVLCRFVVHNACRRAARALQRAHLDTAYFGERDRRFR